jgi:predicted metal-dependent HD superfamily phosphohydrolase
MPDTLPHIAACFDALHELLRLAPASAHGAAAGAPLAPVPAVPRAVTLALLFHDAVYDPRAKDNEEASAALAQHALRELVAPVEGDAAAAALGDRVAALIMRTKHLGAGGEVAPDAAGGGGVSAEGAVVAREGDLVVDADLSVLATRNRAAWDAYEAGIAAEYAWVGEEAYRVGRLRVLQGFAAKPRLFVTPEAAAAGWEAAAKSNLARAIAVLEAAAGARLVTV